jgi:putative Holliday junction resolvase
MGRIVAIDFGEKKIGLATSDLSKQIAFPFKTVLALKDPALTIEAIMKVLKEKEPIELFVIGLPLHLDGNDSPMSLKAKEFGNKLHEITKIEVTYFDERLSSKQVDARLKEHHLSRKKRDEASDVLAAQVILEAFLFRLPHQKS